MCFFQFHAATHRRKTDTPLLGRKNYAQMPPPEFRGSISKSDKSYGARPYRDNEVVEPEKLATTLAQGQPQVQGQGDDVAMRTPQKYDEENMYVDPHSLTGDLSTPWGTKRRSQLSEMGPEYQKVGSQPQLGTGNITNSGTVVTVQGRV